MTRTRARRQSRTPERRRTRSSRCRPGTSRTSAQTSRRPVAARAAGRSYSTPARICRPAIVLRGGIRSECFRLRGPKSIGAGIAKSLIHLGPAEHAPADGVTQFAEAKLKDSKVIRHWLREASEAMSAVDPAIESVRNGPMDLDSWDNDRQAVQTPQQRAIRRLTQLIDTIRDAEKTEPHGAKHSESVRTSDREPVISRWHPRRRSIETLARAASRSERTHGSVCPSPPRFGEMDARGSRNSRPCNGRKLSCPPCSKAYRQKSKLWSRRNDLRDCNRRAGNCLGR